MSPSLSEEPVSYVIANIFNGYDDGIGTELIIKKKKVYYVPTTLL